jgi:hypothetical protein
LDPLKYGAQLQVNPRSFVEFERQVPLLEHGLLKSQILSLAEQPAPKCPTGQLLTGIKPDEASKQKDTIKLTNYYRNF